MAKSHFLDKKKYVIYLFIKKKEKCFISLVIIGKHIIFSVVFLWVFFSLNQWHSIEIVRHITWPKIKKKEVIWLQNLFNYIRLSRQGSNWQIRCNLCLVCTTKPHSFSANSPDNSLFKAIIEIMEYMEMHAFFIF